MTGIKFKNWKSYLYGFLMSWIWFIVKIVSNRPVFIEEYGWIAYQPFTFLVIFGAIAIGRFSELSQKAIERKCNASDKLLMCFIYSVKVTIIFSAVAIFYVYILGNKPNLFICL